MRNVTIKRVMNGFVVEVGCQRLVFETTEKLLVELRRYIDNPSGVERAYTEQYGLVDGSVVEPAPGLPNPGIQQGYDIGALRRQQEQARIAATSLTAPASDTTDACETPARNHY